MTSKIIEDAADGKYADYLRDESRRTGRAEFIAFPRTEEELREVLLSSCLPVTLQGGRTGITAGAVPEGGLVVNLSRMSSVLGIRQTGMQDTPYSITVQPGMPLKELRRILEAKAIPADQLSSDAMIALRGFTADSSQYFFPPDPTEDTASVGGMIACNASGARSFKYGATRAYVHSIRVMLADGTVLTLTRGVQRAVGRRFTVGAGKREFKGILPSYSLPCVKNASGFFAEDNMDLLDLFVGSEGTLGVVTQAELLLMRAPSVNWAIMAFLPGMASAEQCVGGCRSLETGSIAAIEFFDQRSLDLLRRQKHENAAFSYLPELKPEWQNCIYVELDGMDESEVEAVALNIAEIIVQCGGSEESTWMATAPQEIEKMKKFRHALPEAVNMTIDKYRRTAPEITKLGTDLAVTDAHLHEMLERYERDLSAAGLDYVIFGHIGNNHLHVNILPRSTQEYALGKELYEKWAASALALGGTVSAEHGIGKLKRSLLRQMFGNKGIDEMKDVKGVFDPAGRMNSGNLFEESA